MARLSGRIQIERLVIAEHRMRPAAAAANWPVPPIPTLGALADWLWVEYGELDWLADLKNLSHNYSRRLLTKRSGGVRVIESPKLRLKKVQRQILAYILNAIPTHEAAHGFVIGRSTKTFAAPHVGQEALVRLDVQDFFPSIRRSRIQTFFRTAGYPESVADALGGICTAITPRGVVPGREDRQLYAMPHLPQGAPTSPALANLCCYRLDCRLTGLATAFGANYTRYADDLAFSGGPDFARRATELPPYVGAILIEEGFSANFHKTRIMRPSVRQHLAGLVVNQSVHVARRDYDQLKAILTNCRNFGPASQNRDVHPDFRAHLEGRIGYIESIQPGKGEKLRRMFEQISWPI